MGIFAAKKEIGPDTVLQRKQDLLFNIVDGEVVMLSVENGEYYGMDKIAGTIWQFLSVPINFRNLIEKLADRYEVSEEKCSSDTLFFLNKLLDKGLILITN
jgi:hypothetical protein